jgi:hypothetical protein
VVSEDEEDMGSWRRHTPLNVITEAGGSRGCDTLRNAGKNAKQHAYWDAQPATSRRCMPTSFKAAEQAAHRRYEQGGSRSFSSRPCCVLHCQGVPSG